MLFHSLRWHPAAIFGARARQLKASFAIAAVVALSLPGGAIAQSFTDVSHSHRISSAAFPSFGSPIWADFDNDGLLDVYVGDHHEAPQLLLNGGGFTNIFSTSGLQPLKQQEKMGAAWGDFNNDGNEDLYVTMGAGSGGLLGEKSDKLFENLGGDTFQDVTDSAGVTNTYGRGRSVNFVDFNNDGWLDIFVKNFKTPNVLYQNNGNGTFTDVATAAGIANAAGTISSWADYNNSGCRSLFVTGPGAPDQLWRNNCDGTFTDVTAAAGFANSNGFAIAWGDYNNDGNIDLFVSRGVKDENGLMWNANGVTFSNKVTSSQAGVDFTTSGSQVTFALYSEKCPNPAQVFYGRSNTSPTISPFTLTAAQARGKPTYVGGQSVGVFIWANSKGWHVRWSAGSKRTFFYGTITSDGPFTSAKPFKILLQGTYPASSLYRNNGDGTFTDVTASAGLADPTNNRAAVWGDYDNDGYLDLFVVNSGSIEGNGVNHLYHNNGDGTFTDVATADGLGTIVNGRGAGAAWGDFNGDGALDLFVVNGDDYPVPTGDGSSSCLEYGPHRLYKNSGNGNNWLDLILQGTTSNRDGIGARVMLKARTLSEYRQLNGGGGEEYSQGAVNPVHFGLAKHNIVDSITIDWPSGIVQTLRKVAANQTLTVVEP
jgi:ASPIC and UnbV/FG-GAP-like repeat